jgi:hypothetical protein
VYQPVLINVSPAFPLRVHMKSLTVYVGNYINAFLQKVHGYSSSECPKNHILHYNAGFLYTIKIFS